MASFGVALPVSQNTADGFTMLKSFKRLAKQNLKMLLLTSPGERVMEPEFGVGMKQYLFENFTSTTYAAIDKRIKEQVAIYLPAIIINAIDYSALNQDKNRLLVRIKFEIQGLGITEMLEITI